MGNPLVLGTVQFGLPYGIANKSGQPNQAAVTEIIRLAWNNGINEFDTAQDYGTSEDVLGAAFRELGILKEVKVISKINPDLDHCDPSAMAKALDETLKKLGIPFLFGLMLHNENMLSLWTKGLGSILRNFVFSGKVKKLGISVYSVNKALEALDINELDLIQLPSNILDRRFERSRVFESAAEKNKQIYIRSVFLQGLILMAAENLPQPMSFAKPVIQKIEDLSRRLKLSRKELALLYIKKRAPTAKLVIGVDSQKQLLEDISALTKKPPANLVSSVVENFADIDEMVLNPTLWKKQ